MRYNELFHPLFSLAAHAAQACGRKDPSPAEARDIVADILRLVASTLAEGRSGGRADFEEAWFPVCVWLDESLSPLWRAVGKDAPLQKMHFKTSGAGRLFFEKLDRLLTGGGTLHADCGEVLDLYATCLDLGFHGHLDRPEDRPLLRDFRLRCLEALSPGPERPAAVRPPGLTKRSARTVSNGMALAFWAAPVIVTVALYGVYRLLLSEWYWRIIG